MPAPQEVIKLIENFEGNLDMTAARSRTRATMQASRAPVDCYAGCRDLLDRVTKG